MAGISLAEFWRLTLGELVMVCRSFARRVRIENGIPEPEAEVDFEDDSLGVLSRLEIAARGGN